jgi:hypothetical protein
MERDEITGRIRGLVIRLGDRLSTSNQVFVEELVDHNEPMLAIEFMADDLSELDSPLSEDERADLVGLAEHFGSNRAIGAIALCPALVTTAPPVL